MVIIRRMSSTGESPSSQIGRAAGVVMAGFVLSNLAGLFRQILTSRAFGTSFEIDAFNAAARLPETLFSLVAGGALASAFIPTFTGLLLRQDRHSAWELASAVLNLVSLLLAAASLLAAIFAEPIVAGLLAPRFPPAQQALTVSLLRILLISPAIFGISGLLMGILNSHQHFLLPALAPSLHWAGWIVGLIFLVPRYGIYGLAWGAVLGAGLHLVVQLPGLRVLNANYHFSFGWSDPLVRSVARLMGPRVFGAAVVQLNFWVNVILASGMPEGSLTALAYAFAIMTMPQVVIAQALAIAALPTFSAQAARGELPEMRRALAATLRGALLLSVPAAAGLIVLRYAIVAMLFQRGEFDFHSTDLVAQALLWFTVGLVSHAVVEIVSRAFYALQDTRTPVTIGAAAMGINVGLSLILSSWFSRLGLFPHAGLALANSLATTLEMIALLVVMRRRLGGLEGRRVLGTLVKALAGSLLLYAAVRFWLVFAYDRWLAGLGGVAIGLVLYGAAMVVLKVEELRRFFRK